MPNEPTDDLDFMEKARSGYVFSEDLHLLWSPTLVPNLISVFEQIDEIRRKQRLLNET